MASLRTFSLLVTPTLATVANIDLQKSTNLISLQAVSSELASPSRSSPLIKSSKLSCVGDEVAVSKLDIASGTNCRILRGGGIGEKVGSRDIGDNEIEDFDDGEYIFYELEDNSDGDYEEMMKQEEEAGEEELLTLGLDVDAEDPQGMWLREEVGFDNEADFEQEWRSRDKITFDDEDEFEENDVYKADSKEESGDKSEAWQFENEGGDLSGEEGYTNQDETEENDAPSFWSRLRGRNEKDDMFDTNEDEDIDNESVRALESDLSPPYEDAQITEYDDDQQEDGLFDERKENKRAVEPRDGEKRKSSVWKFLRNRGQSDEDVLELDLVKDQSNRDSEEEQDVDDEEKTSIDGGSSIGSPSDYSQEEELRDSRIENNRVSEQKDEVRRKSPVWKFWKNRDQEVLELDLVEDQANRDAGEEQGVDDEETTSIDVDSSKVNKINSYGATSKKTRDPRGVSNAIKNTKGSWRKMSEMANIKGRDKKRNSNRFVSIKRIPAASLFASRSITMPSIPTVEWATLLSNIPPVPSAAMVIIGAMLFTTLVQSRNGSGKDGGFSLWVRGFATHVGGCIRSLAHLFPRVNPTNQMEDDSTSQRSQASNEVDKSTNNKARWWSLNRTRGSTQKQPSIRKFSDEISTLRQNLRYSEFDKSRLQSEFDLAMRKLDEYRNQMTSLGARNTFLLAQNRDSDRILQKALQVERQRSNEEIERVKETMQIVLERERRLMRSQSASSARRARVPPFGDAEGMQ